MQTKSIGFAIAAFFFFSLNNGAHAQATRTWVSGVGDDANPCSRTAPCKTFPGAISKTAAHGEINCLDPGGFGGVTITKSITIDCSQTQGGLLVAGTNAIIVAAGAADVIVLRGIDIEGVGTGVSGIHFSTGGQLHVHNSIIRNFNTASSFGINFVPSNNASLFVSDTHIVNNGVGANGGGIRIRPTGAASAVAMLNRVTAAGNSFGIIADSAGTTSAVSVAIRESVVTGSPNNGIVFTGGAPLKGSLDKVSSVGNGFGLVANGASTLVVAHHSVVSQNMTGLARFNGGQIASFMSNMFAGNITSDGTPSSQQGSQDASTQ